MGKCHTFTIVITIVNASINLATASLTVCSYGRTPPEAVIGQRMDLTCQLNRDEPCFSGIYDWYHYNQSDNTSLSEQSKVLVISENVSSAAEVGGQMYSCHCSGTSFCRLFKIGVKPRVCLHISSKVAKTGSSVNVTCMAESYPPTNSIHNYQMKHPKNTPITRVLLPGMNGVVHIITSADKTLDAGEYECTVNVSLREYSIPLQSDNEIANLTVYDAPMIGRASNFTITDVGQEAILKCWVVNTEDKLKVWVNWTTIERRSIIKKHVMLEKDHVFYLLVSNSTAEEYLCQLFSSYSQKLPEDMKTVSVSMSETADTSPEGLSERKDNCNDSGFLAGIALLSSLVIIFIITTIIASTLLGFQCYKRKHGGSYDPMESRDSNIPKDSTKTVLEEKVPCSLNDDGGNVISNVSESDTYEHGINSGSPQPSGMEDASSKTNTVPAVHDETENPPSRPKRRYSLSSPRKSIEEEQLVHHEEEGEH